jgi:hypothetical protein
MLLVRRLVLIVITVLAAGSIIFVGIRSHNVLVAGIADPQQIKLAAEDMLFLAIVAATLILVVSGWVTFRSLRVDRRMERIIELARFGNASIDTQLSKLGHLGEQIRRLHHHLSETGKKQALKISAQAGLMAFLLENLDLPAVVLDPTGRVTGLSPKSHAKLDKDVAKAVGRHVSDVLPEVSFGDVSGRLEHGRKLIEIDGVQYYPIFNRDGELASVVCILTRETINEASTPDLPRRDGGRRGQFFSRLMRRRSG